MTYDSPPQIIVVVRLRIENGNPTEKSSPRVRGVRKWLLFGDKNADC
jgi:hypothetical protein